MSATKVAEALNILHRDREESLLKIERYMRGDHDKPYAPDTADAEFTLLQKRAITNILPLAVKNPCQGLAIDGYNRGGTVRERVADLRKNTPEWDSFKRGGSDVRQDALYLDSATYGMAYTVEVKTEYGSKTKMFSPLMATAVYDDPTNDDAPVGLLHILKMPDGKGKNGVGEFWDERFYYTFSFRSLADEAEGITITKSELHGLNECPGNEFFIQKDLLGNRIGIIEPLFRVQDRLNQTVFDLLMAQTYGSFQIRTITGMAPPTEMELVRDEQGNIVGSKPKIDPNTGRPKPAKVNLNASRFMWAEDADTKFGSLPGTSLNGYIDAIDLAFRHFSAMGQTPPHYLLGQIANLSAEALQAAEASRSRLIRDMQGNFGAAWKRQFRLKGLFLNDAEIYDDYDGEVTWVDVEQKSLSKVADGLVKLKEINIPDRGLWEMVPGVTSTQLADWEEWYDEQDTETKLAIALERASGGMSNGNQDDAEESDTSG